MDKAKKAGKKKEAYEEEFTHKAPEGNQTIPVPEIPSRSTAIIIDKSTAFGGKADTE
jgi:hypothetical protein